MFFLATILLLPLQCITIFNVTLLFIHIIANVLVIKFIKFTCHFSSYCIPCASITIVQIFIILDNNNNTQQTAATMFSFCSVFVLAPWPTWKRENLQWLHTQRERLKSFLFCLEYVSYTKTRPRRLVFFSIF